MIIIYSFQFSLLHWKILQNEQNTLILCNNVTCQKNATIKTIDRSNSLFRLWKTSPFEKSNYRPNFLKWFSKLESFCTVIYCQKISFLQSNMFLCVLYYSTLFASRILGYPYWFLVDGRIYTFNFIFIPQF